MPFFKGLVDRIFWKRGDLDSVKGMMIEGFFLKITGLLLSFGGITRLPFLG